MDNASSPRRRRRTSAGGDGGGFFGGIEDNSYRSFATSWTHLFRNNLTNEFRLGYNRVNSQRQQINADKSSEELLNFPGGFPGDKRNAFSSAGRSKQEEDLFQYIRKLTMLRNQLEPLKQGALVNLYVSDQQYAYARKTKTESVVVVINNASKPAEIEFDAAPAGLASGNLLFDTLGVSKWEVVRDGKVKIKLPERSASIFVRSNFVFPGGTLSH